MRYPKILVGTNSMSQEALMHSVKAQLKFGLAAFDTAPNYKSEGKLGKIIQDAVEKQNARREDFFIQTKLDCIDQINNNVEGAFYKSLKETGLEYLDSYLMHWPYPDTFVDDWKILEKLYKHGLVRNIGVCNFRERHWKKLLDSNIEILPHINQIEIHPLRTCDELLSFCKDRNISVQAYSPICKMLPPISENKILQSLSEKYGKSIPEIILAWHIHRGVAPITKSSKPSRLTQNINSALTLSLSTDDLNSITALNENYKFFVESWGCPGF